MSEIRVASRYAKSLLELASEKGILEEVHNDMQLFTNTANASRELVHLLESPVVKSEKKLSVLKAVFQGKVNDLTLKFIELVSQKERENLLSAIAREFHNQYNALNGIQKATVTTTFPLDAQMRKTFIETAKRVSGAREIELTEKVDSGIIGGYILKVGDKQIDDSLSSKLQELKYTFTQN
jgi:F-type H+-transporting ATPase subunit delta